MSHKDNIGVLAPKNAANRTASITNAVPAVGTRGKMPLCRRTAAATVASLNAFNCCAGWVCRYDSFSPQFSLMFAN